MRYGIGRNTTRGTPPATWRMETGRRGFTLIELTVTLAIFALMAAIAVPAITWWLPDYRVRTAARELGSVFQNARLRAVSTSNEVRVAFNTSNSPFSYQIELGNAPSGSGVWTVDRNTYGEFSTDVIMGPVAPATTAGSLVLYRPNGTTATVAGNLVVFRPNGSTTVGAEFKAQIANNRGTRYETRVSNTTGRVHVGQGWTP